MKIAFVVPGKPQGKERPRFNSKTGRVFTPPRTRGYETQVRGIALRALHRARMQGFWPRDAEYMLRLRLFFPDRRRRDADNVIKAIQDACTGVLWDDDHRVGIECPPWRVDKERPRAEVTVEVL